jgi:hypothetical protein
MVSSDQFVLDATPSSAFIVMIAQRKEKLRKDVLESSRAKLRGLSPVVFLGTRTLSH